MPTWHGRRPECAAAEHVLMKLGRDLVGANSRGRAVAAGGAFRRLLVSDSVSRAGSASVSMRRRPLGMGRRAQLPASRFLAAPLGLAADGAVCLGHGLRLGFFLSGVMGVLSLYIAPDNARRAVTVPRPRSCQFWVGSSRHSRFVTHIRPCPHANPRLRRSPARRAGTPVADRRRPIRTRAARPWAGAARPRSAPPSA